MTIMRAKVIDTLTTGEVSEQEWLIHLDHVKSHIKGLDKRLVAAWALLMHEKSYDHHLPTIGHKVSIGEKSFTMCQESGLDIDIEMCYQDDRVFLTLAGCEAVDVSPAFSHLIFDPYYATMAKIRSSHDSKTVRTQNSFSVISEFFGSSYGHGGDLLMAFIDAFIAHSPKGNLGENRCLDFILTACARQEGLRVAPGMAHLYRNVALMMINARYIDTPDSPLDEGFIKGKTPAPSSDAAFLKNAARDIVMLLDGKSRKEVVYATTLLEAQGNNQASAFENASAHEIMGANALMENMMSIINAMPLPD